MAPLRLIGVKDGDTPATALAVLYLDLSEPGLARESNALGSLEKSVTDDGERRGRVVIR
jgi:hypothetical protein